MVSQKFCNILIHASLQYIYHVAKAVQAEVGTHCGWLHYGSWCADTLCVI